MSDDIILHPGMSARILTAPLLAENGHLVLLSYLQTL